MIVSRTPLAMMVISIAAAACTAPAQESDHFAALVTPPASAGTCVAGQVPVMRDPTGGELTAHHLVMTTIDPGGRREMTVYTDSAGQPRHYVDWARRMTSPGESSGESVVATILPDGRVRGMRLRSDRTTGVAPEHPTDTAAHHATRAGATVGRPPAPLTASQHEQVHEVATWLARRCPA